MAQNSRTTSINLNLPTLPETKGPDFAEFLRLYNALNILALALDSYTGSLVLDESAWPEISPTESIRSQNIKRLYLPYYEDMVPGTPIYLFDDAGTLKARKAIASLVPSLADGFAGTETLAGEVGYVYLGEGLNPFISGLTPGTIYYLSQGVAGTIIAVRPGAGLIQPLGRAISETELWWSSPLI